jgi:hypothetical protein
MVHTREKKWAILSTVLNLLCRLNREISVLAEEIPAYKNTLLPAVGDPSTKIITDICAPEKCECTEQRVTWSSMWRYVVNIMFK